MVLKYISIHSFIQQQLPVSTPIAIYCARCKGRVKVSMPPVRYIFCQATVTLEKEERLSPQMNDYNLLFTLPLFICQVN